MQLDLGDAQTAWNPLEALKWHQNLPALSFRRITLWKKELVPPIIMENNMYNIKSNGSPTFGSFLDAFG